MYITWFDSNTVAASLKSMGLYGYVPDIWLFSYLILIVFLIAQARYSMARNAQTAMKKLQLYLGFYLALALVSGVLFFYYGNIYAEKLSHRLYFNKTIGAKSTIVDASRIYMLHGEKSEYFDDRGTVLLYKPTEDIIETREYFERLEAKRHLVPLYLVIIFMSLILSYPFGTWLAKKNNEDKNDS